MKKPDLSKERVIYLIKFSILLLILTFIRALCTYIFIVPNGFAPGGIGGISSIIYNAVLPSRPDLAATIFDPGITTFIMNIPLLIIAFIILDRKFAYNTFFVVLIYSLFMYLFGAVNFPQYNAEGDAGIKLIAALSGGVGCGVSLGFMLRKNMSMGGTDIIGKLIYRKNSAAEVQWWIFACDCVVSVASGFLGFIGLDLNSATPTQIMTALLSPVLFSFISLFATSEVSDVIASGFISSYVFTIITDKPEEISQAIIEQIHHGVTMSKCVGYYTKKERDVLTCVVSKKQVNAVKNIIESIDSHAFTYISKAKEVDGIGFNRMPK